MAASTFQQQIQIHASNWVRDQLTRNPDLLLFTHNAPFSTASSDPKSWFLAVRKTLLNHRYAILQPEEFTLYFNSPSVLGEFQLELLSHDRPCVTNVTIHATQPVQAESVLKLLRRVKTRALGSSVD